MGLSGLQKGVCLHVTAEHAKSLFLDAHLCIESLGGHPPASVDKAGAPPAPSGLYSEGGVGGGRWLWCWVFRG